MQFRKIRSRGKENGKDVTNHIEFTTDLANVTPEKANEMEWDMFAKAGGMQATQMSYKVNPYKFARTQFSQYINPDQIVSRSLGTDKLMKERAFQIMSSPMVSPYLNMPEVVDEFVLKEFGGNDPDRFKKDPAQLQQDLAMMSGQQPQPMAQ